MTWTTDEILREVKELENQTKQLKQELLKICWFMRGSISYEDVFYMSVEEREIIAKIIKDNLDSTKKTGLPFF